MPRFIPNTGQTRPRVEHLVQRVEQEAVAAQRDDQLGLLERHEIVALAQHRLGRLRRLRVGGDQRHRPVAACSAMGVATGQRHAPVNVPSREGRTRRRLAAAEGAG